MNIDADDFEADPGMNVRVELAQFGVAVDISTSGGYNPDQLDDMTTRAQRLLETACAQYVAVRDDLDELDDFVEHDGSAPYGDLVTEAPNPT